jgi:hypothetical protein
MLKRLILVFLTILLSIIVYSKQPHTEKVPTYNFKSPKTQPINYIMVGGSDNIKQKDNKITYRKLQGDYSTLNEKNKTSHTILPSLSF